MAGIAVHVQAALARALLTDVEAERAGQVAAAGLREAVAHRVGLGVVFVHPDGA